MSKKQAAFLTSQEWMDDHYDRIMVAVEEEKEKRRQRGGATDTEPDD